jgi:hypothetical protein
LSLSDQKYGCGIRDPGCGKNLFPDLGSKRQRIPEPDPQRWEKLRLVLILIVLCILLGFKKTTVVPVSGKLNDLFHLAAKRIREG